MIEQELAKIFKENDWRWKVAGKGDIVPDEDDIEAALDEAARLLYNEQVGAQLEVGRLIIKKKHRGHDIYVFVGEYE